MKKIFTMVCIIWIILNIRSNVYAQTTTLEDGTVFDSDYYADTYPDLKAAFGYNYNALLNHYLNYGRKEGRVTNSLVTLEDGTIFNAYYYANAYPDLKAAFGYDNNALLNHYLTYGKKEGRISNGELVSNNLTLVDIDKLENKKSLQGRCSDEEFQAAYNVAATIVTPLIGLDKKEQLEGIRRALRSMVNSGQVIYSTNVVHYDDPYGYLVKGVASCAGCARATGLCLNMLGISYEHVNENQWSHQWCRVNIDGVYWICDAYGLYVGPEDEPYAHPLIPMF